MDKTNYSGTKCPKCNKSDFELAEDTPTHSKYKMFYIRCSDCKTFLQAIPYIDTTLTLSILEADINKIKTKMGVL
jgi:hypothetical protein